MQPVANDRPAYETPFLYVAASVILGEEATPVLPAALLISPLLYRATACLRLSAMP